MLQSPIVASKVGDITDEPGRADATTVRPLDARSLALSTLLGTHPPALPGNRLVALAELFGIAGGTMRTALSRLVAAGDLTVDDGRYRLVGRLLERQQAQDEGRRTPSEHWDGTWLTAIALDERRPLDERRRTRQVLVDHRFGELRPDTWLRPANLPAPDLDGGWAVISGTASVDDGELAHRLWDLPAIAAVASVLVEQLDAASAELGDDPAAIPPAFRASAAVVRFLRTEPMLPSALVPAGWPVDALRERYDLVEADLQRALRSYMAAHA
jgi:phenylacetic acid degradation operon negative regulatory protein